MAQLTMYPAKINSPATTLQSAITDTATSMTLVDATVLPAAPGLATIGTGDSAETVLYTIVAGNVVTITRAFQGSALAWDAGTPVARYYTAYDHDTFKANIEDLVTDKVSKTLVDAAGDLIVGSAADTVARLAVGTAGQSLLSDGTTPVWSNLFTTANITYYVNASTGSDSTGDGSSGAPFATIQYAIDLIPQIVNHTVTINVAAGTYNESPSIRGFVGKGTITLKGNSSTTVADSEDYKINKLVVASCSCEVTVWGFNSIAAVGNTNFYVAASISVDIRYCMAVASESSANAFYTYYSHVQLIGCHASNHNAAVWASRCSTVVSANWTAGTGNTIGIRAEYAATIGRINTQPQGTTAESVQYGGEIR